MLAKLEKRSGSHDAHIYSPAAGQGQAAYGDNQQPDKPAATTSRHAADVAAVENEPDKV